MKVTKVSLHWLAGHSAMISIYHSRIALAAFFLSLSTLVAHAQPSGGTVISGAASVAQDLNATIVTAGNNSVLRWDSFDVAPSHTVEFVQPSAEARVLNWIGGLTASQIDGTLRANGQVYLVNPAGVYFGRTAVVDAARLYAVAGSLSKEDFFAGSDRFTGLTGEVRNAGSLSASTVALIGRSVANSGSIVSPNGFVTLAAGDQVLLGRKGSNIYVDTGISVPAESGAAGADIGIANSGSIDTDRGGVVLAAGDLYSVAISHSGLLRGKDVRVNGQSGGRVVVSGAIDVSSQLSGENGGYAEVTGQHVQLLDEAKMSANGTSGGGTILAGGDAHGATASVRNAETITVLEGATLQADAIDEGDGGKVVVWSDEWTRYAGSLSARGGALRGDGGFAEVSGARLVFVGSSDLSAPNGARGNLLLDPFNITISNESDKALDFFDPSVFSPGDDDSIISWATLLRVLNNSDVEVSTDVEGGSQFGDITIAASPAAGAYNTAFQLRLRSSLTGGIFVNAPVVNAGPGNIQLEAGYRGIRLNGTAGTTILGTRGALSLETFSDSVQGIGVLASEIEVNLSSALGAGQSNARIETATPLVYLGGSSFYVTNSHAAGLTVVWRASSAVYDIVSLNAARTADAPLKFQRNSEGSQLSSATLWGSDITVEGFFSATSLTVGNSGTLVVGGEDGLSAPTLIFENSGNIGTLSDPLLTQATSIIFNKTGGNAFLFNERFGAGLTISGSSTNTLINLVAAYAGFSPSRTPITVGPQSLTATNVSLDASTITLNGGINSSITTLTHTGLLSGVGAVSATSQIDLNGNGGIEDGTEGQLQTRTPTIVLNKGGTSSVFISNANDSGLLVSGVVGGTLAVESFNGINQGAAALTIPTLGLTAGDEVQLSSSTMSFSGNINAPIVGLEGAVTRLGGIITASDEILLGGTGDVGSINAPLVTATPVVWVVKGGAVYLDNGASDIRLTIAVSELGETFAGGAFRGRALSLQQVEMPPINVGANSLSLSSTGNLDLGGEVITANSLTLAHDGALLNYATPVVNTLVLGGAGNDGTAANPLRTSSTTLVLQKGAGANVYINNGNDAGLTLSGSNPLTLSLASMDGDYVAPVQLTIGAGGLSGTGSTTLASSALSLNGAIASPTLVLNANGIVSGNGALTATTGLTINGSGNIGSASSSIATVTPALVLNRPTGAVYINNGANPLSLTPTAFTGGGSFSSGNFTLLGPINAGTNDLSFTSSGTLSFGPHALSANQLTLAHDGALLLTSTGNLSMNTLVLGGSGNIGSAANPFTFSVENLIVNKTAPSIAYLLNARDAGLNLGGTTSGALTLTSQNAAKTGVAPLAIIPTGFNSTAPVSLTSSTLTLTGDLAGSTVLTNQSDSLNGVGVVRASNELTLAGSGNVGTSAAFISTRTPTLVLNKPAGLVYVDNGGGDLALNPMIFAAGGEFRTGNFSLLGPLNVGTNDLSFTSSGTLSFGPYALNANRLTLAHDGALLLTSMGNLSMNTLVLGGAGNIGSAASPFTFSVENLIVNKTAPSIAYLLNARDAGLNLGGTTSGAVTLTSQNAAKTGVAPLTIIPTGFNSTAPVSLTSSTLTLTGDLAGSTVLINQSDSLNGAGVVRASNELTLASSGNVGTSAAFISTRTPTLVLNKPAGLVYVDNGGGDLALNPMTFTGGGAFRTGNFSLLGPINVGSNAFDLTSAGSISLGAYGILGGAVGLSTVGPLNLTGIFQANQLTLSGTGDVSISSSNVPILVINKPSGSVVFDNASSDLSILPTLFTGGGRFSGRNLSLLGAIDVGVNAVSMSSSGALDLNSFRVRAGEVTLHHDGMLSDMDLIDTMNLVLAGGGDAGSSSARLNFSVASLELKKTGSGNVYADNKRDAGLTLSGFSSGGTVSIGSLNSAGSAPSALTIGSSSLTLSQPGVVATSVTGGSSRAAAVPSGSVILSGDAVGLSGGVTAANITLNNTGLVTGSGVLLATSKLDLENTGDVGSSSAAILANTPAIFINKSAGQVFIDNSGAPLSLTPVVFVGGGAFSSDSLDLLGPVSIGTNSLTLNTTGALNLGAFDITAESATFNNQGNLSGTGLVTASELILGSDGTVGTIGSPLLFSGGPDNVVLNRLATGVNIGYFGGRGVYVPTDLVPSIAVEASVFSAAQYDSEASTVESDSDASVNRNSRRGGGAAFRAISTKAELTAAAREQLQALGIYARPLSTEERSSRERKEAVFVTVPAKERPVDSDFEVVDARIDPVALQEVLRLATDIGLTETSRNSLEPVAKSLASSFAAFSEGSSSADAAGFRSWLEKRGDADAKAILDFVSSIRSTIGQIEMLGLTRQETDVSKTQIFGNILSRRLNADPDFLRALVEEPARPVTTATNLTSKVDGLVLR